MSNQLKQRHAHHVPPGQGPCICYGGLEMNVKVGAEESSGEMTVIECLIPPNGGPPLHVHEKENEMYYVLEGEFEFVCGDQHVTGGPGAFVFAPPGGHPKCTSYGQLKMYQGSVATFLPENVLR